MYHNYRYGELEAKSNHVGIIFDVMVTGVTGAGKSTTLNAIFDKEIATVGRGVDPETMELDSYLLNESFRLWDTPGLGHGKQKDLEHSEKLISLLFKDYDNIYGFIDLVLVIVEGSNRDMGTSYKLLNNIIVPNFQKERILVAVNQADFAMKGRYWNENNNKPEQPLFEFLMKKVESIQKGVRESTGIEIKKPIFYSAEYGYNIDKLLDLLIDNMPKEKRRMPIVDGIALRG